MAKSSKTKKGGKKSLISAVKGKSSPKAKKGVIETVKGAIGMGRKGGHHRRHKKSAIWYAKEIARLKLKKRYEKVRIGV